MEAFSQMWIEPYEFTDMGTSFSSVQVRWTSAATGIEIEFTAAHLLTFRAEQVVRLEFYPGRDEALAAAGQPG